jgi:hypothetical protein
MDTLGNSSTERQLGASDEDLDASIRGAARQALHDGERSTELLEDLVQDIWTFYLEPRNRSTRKFVEKATTETGRRRVFYRLEEGEDGKMVRAGIASRIIGGWQNESNLFQGNDVYSSDAVKDWLSGVSTNKYLGPLVTDAMSDLQDSHLEAIRGRYEQDEPAYRIPGAAAMRLARAVKALTEGVNDRSLADKSGEVKVSRGSSASASGRRGSGYSDPTADMALGLIKGGDIEIETASGEVTTMRKEFEDADNIFATRYDNPTQPWTGIDLFEGELNDRTDMYRAQVFPELYPNEKPMLVGNWSREDQEVYCGGDYTPGYRRLKVVK